MADTTSPFGKEILSLLKEPIEDECFMIELSWWNNWVSYVKNNDKGEVGPIFNLQLV